MATLYVIPNWERDFENNKSRSIENPTWMPVQTHFDGKRINRLKKLSRPLEKYGAFHVIAAIASRCEYRGVLLDNDGPVGPLEIADKTGFAVKELAAALEELSSPLIGLLEKHEIVQADDGSWPLPDAVRHWATHRSARRHRGARGGTERTPSAAECHEVPRNQPGTYRPKRHLAAPSGHQVPPSATRSRQKGREQKGREQKDPLPSPSKGDSPRENLSSSTTRSSCPPISKADIKLSRSRKLSCAKKFWVGKTRPGPGVAMRWIG